MYQEVLINVESEEKRVAIVEEQDLEEFYVERHGIQKLVGNIYKGVVESIVPAIGAAFVNIGLGKNGFLYVQDLKQPDYEKMAEIIERPSINGTAPASSPASSQIDIKKMFKVGQEVMVQVVKEPLGRKGPRLTTHVALPGRYLVLMPADSNLGISRRIQDANERARLREMLKGLGLPQNMGLIVRTVGSGSTKKEFIQDLRYLMNLWRRIRVSLQRNKAPVLVHEEYDLVLRIIRDNFTNQTNKLWVDSKEEHRRIIRFLSIFSPNLRSRVHYHTGEQSLFVKKGIEDKITKIYDRQVSLKSGGYLMIEPTESLVAIDVNSGRYTGKKDPEENAYLVNLEAAKEIARQIRLRDLGGIVVTDFIDMKLPKHKKRVFDVLQEALKRDHAKTDISAVSELGLIEMSRQRVRKSLESVVYQSCPYCQGKGLVKSAASMAILVLRRIRKILQTQGTKAIFVFTHPQVASYLLNENRQSITNLENLHKAKVLVKQDPSLHMEELKIEAA